MAAGVHIDASSGLGGGGFHLSGGCGRVLHRSLTFSVPSDWNCARHLSPAGAARVAASEPGMVRCSVRR